MQEFDAAKGLFHLYFSNDDDNYYNESYIKTNQSFDLYNSLLSEKYEYVISFSGDESGNCKMITMDNITTEAFNKKNNSLFGGFFGGGRRSSGSSVPVNEKNRSRSGRKSSDLDPGSFGEAMDNIIAMMKRKNRVAVIMPMNIFQTLIKYPSITDELKRISAKNYQDHNRHAFIITASFYASESIRFFRPGGNALLEDNIFADPELFPDLEAYFHDLYESSANFYIYDNLKSFLGDRIIFNNSLSFEKIRRMMTHFVLQTGKFDNISINEINSLSAVIYAYYNSPEYRTHNNVPLPENPKRSLAAIEEALYNNRGLRERLAEICDEFRQQRDPYKYICRVYTDCIDVENGIYMIGGSEYNAELGMLRAIKRIYTNRFGESHPKLDRAIDIFSKPCIDSAVSFSASNFRSKVIEMTHKNIVNELTDYVDTELIDAMLRALDYYLDYFRNASQLRGETISAKDKCFDFYKDVMSFEERLSGMRKLCSELEQRIAAQESAGDTLSADNTRAYLQRVSENRKQYEAIVDKAYHLLSIQLSDENAVSIVTKIKYETQNLKNAVGTVPVYTKNTENIMV